MCDIPTFRMEGTTLKNKEIESLAKRLGIKIVKIFDQGGDYKTVSLGLIKDPKSYDPDSGLKKPWTCMCDIYSRSKDVQKRFFDFEKFLTRNSKSIWFIEEVGREDLDWMKEGKIEIDDQLDKKFRKLDNELLAIIYSCVDWFKIKKKKIKTEIWVHGLTFGEVINLIPEEFKEGYAFLFEMSPSLHQDGLLLFWSVDKQLRKMNVKYKKIILKLKNVNKAGIFTKNKPVYVFNSKEMKKFMKLPIESMLFFVLKDKMSLENLKNVSYEDFKSKIRRKSRMFMHLEWNRDIVPIASKNMKAINKIREYLKAKKKFFDAISKPGNIKNEKDFLKYYLRRK